MPQTHLGWIYNRKDALPASDERQKRLITSPGIACGPLRGLRSVAVFRRLRFGDVHCIATVAHPDNDSL